MLTGSQTGTASPPRGAGTAAPGLIGSDECAVLHDSECTPAAFCQTWLALQCAVIPGAASGLLLIAGPGGLAVPMAHWSGSPQPLDLTALAGRALAEGRAVIAWSRDTCSDAVLLTVGQPVGPSGAHYGAVAVAVKPVRGVEHADPEALGRQLRAGAGWLETLGQRETVRRSVAESVDARSSLYRAGAAMDALAAIGDVAGLERSCMVLVNEMAKRLVCTRVSMGLVHKGAVRLRMTSHSARMKRLGPLVEVIEDAMEEAVAQAAPVVFPVVVPAAGGGPDAPVGAISLSHQALAAAAGAGPSTGVSHAASVMSVLLPGRGAWPAGVLTFERRAGPAFSAADLALAGAVAALASPIVQLQLRSHRWFAGRLIDEGGLWLGRLIGPRHATLKLAVLAMLAAVAALGLATGTHRVTARAVLEGEILRATVAPFEGFVRDAPARAGDVVRAGDLLAAMDDRDLQLESKKAWAEREKLRQRHQEAISKHDRSATAVLAAQIDQASAALALAEDRLARARMLAPFDGIVVSGDLSQMLGSPIERGKLLFEVAPLHRYRLSLQVDDDSVRWVQPGQEGTLRLAGMPGQPLVFRVSQRGAVATTEDGRNVFKLEATLSQDTEGLRPGMEGVAKVEVGERSLLWVWLHPIADAARLAIYKWWP